MEVKVFHREMHVTRMYVHALSLLGAEETLVSVTANVVCVWDVVDQQTCLSQLRGFTCHEIMNRLEKKVVLAPLSGRGRRATNWGSHGLRWSVHVREENRRGQEHLPQEVVVRGRFVFATTRLDRNCLPAVEEGGALAR